MDRCCLQFIVAMNIEFEGSWMVVFGNLEFIGNVRDRSGKMIRSEAIMSEDREKNICEMSGEIKSQNLVAVGDRSGTEIIC